MAFKKPNNVWTCSILIRKKKIMILEKNVVAFHNRYSMVGRHGQRPKRKNPRFTFWGTKTWRKSWNFTARLMSVLNRLEKVRSGMRKIGEQMRSRIWKWPRHVLNMYSYQSTKIALTWHPKANAEEDGQEKRGEERSRWRDNISDSRHGGRQRWR